VEDWLRSLGQSDEARRCLWNPIALSVMNELPEKASALTFAQALRSAFLGKMSDSTILFSSVGQTELYVNVTLGLLRKQTVLTSTEVAGVEVARGRVTGVRLKDGSLMRSKSVISAVLFSSL